MGTCSACGNEITPGDNFCTNCGARYEPAPASSSPEAGPRVAMAPAFDGHSAAVPGTSFPDPGAAQPDPAAPQFQAAQTAYAGQPQAIPAHGQYASSQPPPSQFSPGSFAPPGGVAASQAAPAPQAAVDISRVPAPAGFGVPQPAAVCPNCGQAWTGSQSCTFCGQVWGLPKGIALSSAGRRFGGYLLDGLLIICTLVIGWIIWTLVVWAQGQTPAKQLLGMRVVRLDTRMCAGWGRMFLRDFVGKLAVLFVSSLLPFIGTIVAYCWLLWDKDKQELWDKLAGTVVVNDPDKVMAPSAQPA
jgi:uncharacterized RDD family membrane protein YckC